MNSMADQINELIEDIFIALEKKERAYSEFQLNNQQYVLLTLIIRNKNTTPSKLAEQMSITKSAVSQQLAKLERKGYIVRQPDGSDRRAVTITLGKKGMKYAKDMKKFRQKISEKYDEHLTRQQLEHMLDSLHKLKTVIDKL